MTEKGYFVIHGNFLKLKSQFMTNRDLFRKIKKLEKIEPSEAWIDSTRSFILDYARIREQSEKKSLVFAPRFNLTEKLNHVSAVFRRKFVLQAASMAVILLISGNFVAAKASESLPGDNLYPVKLLTEKAELALTFNEDKRIDLKFKLAERRLDEFSRLVESGRISPKGSNPDAVNIAMDGFQNQLSSAVSEMDNAAKSGANNSKAVAVAKIADSKTADYAQKIGKATASLNKIADSQAKGKVTEVMNKIEEANITALTVLASANTQSGGGAATQDSKDIAQKVEEKIKNTEEKAKLIDEKVLAVIVENSLAEARGLASSDPVKALEIISDTNKKIDTSIAGNTSNQSDGTATPSGTPSVSPDATPSATPDSSSSPLPSGSPSATPSPQATEGAATPSTSPTVGPSASPEASTSPSPEAIPSATPVPSVSPVITPTPAPVSPASTPVG